MITISLTQRHTIALGAFLACLVLFTFVYAFKQWYSDWQLAHQGVTLAPMVTTADDTSDMITAIPEEHLFGQRFSKIGEAPVTNLQLHVTGIVKVGTEQEGSFSKAYISINGAPSKIYQMGDHLPTGVKIYAITPDAVILENAGRIEKLPLPRTRLPSPLKPISTEGL